MLGNGGKREFKRKMKLDTSSSIGRGNLNAPN